MRLRPNPLAILWVVAAAILGLRPMHAVEKNAIATEAKLVVVGKLDQSWRIPSVKGWRIRAVVIVEEVLYGAAQKGEKLDYEFVCSCCPIWPAPDLGPLLKRPGIWFLCPEAGKKWTSAGSCSDPGWRPAHERPAFEAFLKKWKP